MRRDDVDSVLSLFNGAVQPVVEPIVFGRVNRCSSIIVGSRRRWPPPSILNRAFNYFSFQGSCAHFGNFLFWSRPSKSRQTHNPLPSIIVQIKSIFLEWHVFSVFRCRGVHLYRHPIELTCTKSTTKGRTFAADATASVTIQEKKFARQTVCIMQKKTTLTWPRNDRTSRGLLGWGGV